MEDLDPGTFPPEVLAFFEEYRAAFDELEPRAIASRFDLPSMITDGARTILFRTLDDVLDNMTKLVAIYRHRGYDHAEFKPLSYVPQGGANGVADIEWTIIWKDGGKWLFRAAYNLRRVEGRWKLLLCTAYEEPAFIAQTRTN